MKDEQTLINDFDKQLKKLLKITKDLQKHNDKIIIKCQDNMLSLCIDNKDNKDDIYDLQFAEDLIVGVDFNGYMETIG